MLSRGFGYHDDAIPKQDIPRRKVGRQGPQRTGVRYNGVVVPWRFLPSLRFPRVSVVFAVVSEWTTLQWSVRQRHVRSSARGGLASFRCRRARPFSGSPGGADSLTNPDGPSPRNRDRRLQSGEWNAAEPLQPQKRREGVESTTDHRLRNCQDSSVDAPWKPRLTYSCLGTSALIVFSRIQHIECFALSISPPFCPLAQVCILWLVSYSRRFLRHKSRQAVFHIC